MKKQQIIKAVAHLKRTQYALINELGDRIILKGIYFNVLIYGTPTVSLADFTAQLKSAVDAVALGEKGIDLANRDLQSELLFKMIKKLLNYVNGLYEGDEVNLLKSGFDVNFPSAPHGVAPEPVIKSIVKGTDPHTIKVNLAKFTGPSNVKVEKRTYFVRIYSDESTESFKPGCSSTNSRKLILTNVPFLNALFYTVIIQNTAGFSVESARRKFTLTDT